MLDKGLRCTRKNPQLAYLAPTYGAAKRIAWEYFKMYSDKIPGRIVNEAELRIDIPRPWLGDKVRFILLGAENPGSLKGLYLDLAVLDEYSEMLSSVWTEVIRPALADREGGAIIIGTPKGNNHLFDLYRYAQTDPDWFAALYKASETQVVPQAELDSAKREMPEEIYEQEFECSFSAALVGAFFGKEMDLAEKENRITKVPYQRDALVYTSWDLGIDDSTAIWCFQEIGRELHVIDYIEESGMGLDYYVKELSKRPYNYGAHYFPHDLAVREIGAGGDSREKTVRDLGLKSIRIGMKHSGASFMDSIHKVRMLLNKCWFDADKCAKGISSLKNYQRKWDPKNEVFQMRALHDKHSHGADAFREFADQHRDAAKRPDINRLPRTAGRKYNIFG